MTQTNAVVTGKKTPILGTHQRKPIVEQTWLPMPSCPLVSWVTLSMVLDLSEPELPHPDMGPFSIYFVDWL